MLNEMKHLNRLLWLAISKKYRLGLVIGLVWGLTACGPTTINYQGHRIFNPDYLTAGPPLDMRLYPEQVIQELSPAGFSLVKSYDFLPKEYFLFSHMASSLIPHL